MGEEEETCLSLLSLNDFEEKGVKIEKQWTRLGALVAVTSVASQKLEEENLKNIPVKTKFTELASSSRNCDDGIQKPVRILPPSILNMHYKKNVKESTNAVPKKKELGFVSSSPKRFMGDAVKSNNFRYREVHDKECEVEYCMKQKKKWKRDYKNKKPKRMRKIIQNVIPDLPQEFRARIEEMNGSRVCLIIQKRLFASDVCNGEGRLSIPSNQIISREFLTDNGEYNVINGGKMKVKLIEPLLQECDLILTKWNPRSVSYVLINGWKNVKNRNKLGEGDIVQVWSFRIPPCEELCLALVLVKKGTKAVVDSHQNNGDDDDGVNAWDQG